MNTILDVFRDAAAGLVQVFGHVLVHKICRREEDCCQTSKEVDGGEDDIAHCRCDVLPSLGTLERHRENELINRTVNVNAIEVFQFVGAGDLAYAPRPFFDLSTTSSCHGERVLLLLARSLCSLVDKCSGSVDQEPCLSMSVRATYAITRSATQEC